MEKINDKKIDGREVKIRKYENKQNNIKEQMGSWRKRKKQKKEKDKKERKNGMKRYGERKEIK